MAKLVLVGLALAAIAPFASAQDGDAVDVAAKERQFDFWVGEWNVENRRLGPEGWFLAGKSKARIRPILGGKAILEEWDGLDGEVANTFGISVRFYDPKTGRWVIGLNWPNPRSARFSRMEGAFRHGRAEFFPPHVAGDAWPRATRFTFADALPDTVRWDMANPVDGGGWRTTWIMEFSRTESATGTTAAGERARPAPPNKACVCRHDGARDLDRFVGEWRGTATDGSSVRLVVTSTNRGCGTMCFLDVERPGDAPRIDRSFEAWAFYPEHGEWVARTLDDRNPAFEILVGTVSDAGVGTFVQRDRAGNVTAAPRRVRYEALGDDGLRLVHEQSGDGGESWATRLDARLNRK